MLALVERQNSYIQELEARLQALEDIINNDSGNSNKPPLSDGLKRKPQKSLRKSEGRPRGDKRGIGATDWRQCRSQISAKYTR